MLGAMLMGLGLRQNPKAEDIFMHADTWWRGRCLSYMSTRLLAMLAYVWQLEGIAVAKYAKSWQVSWAQLLPICLLRT